MTTGTRGWRFPFAFEAGGVAMVSDGANVRSALALLLRTRPGERLGRPTLGCRAHELRFAPDAPSTHHLVEHHVREAVGRFEPRVDVVGVACTVESPGVLRIALEYHLLSSGELHQLDVVLDR